MADRPNSPQLLKSAVATESHEFDSLEYLQAQYPRPSRLSEHPKLASLLQTTIIPVHEIFIHKIDTLFDSDFVNNFLFDNTAQVLVLRGLCNAKSLNNVDAKDTWLLYLPAKKTVHAHQCQVLRCDVTSFPRLPVCLFHHEVQMAIEQAIRRHDGYYYWDPTPPSRRYPDVVSFDSFLSSMPYVVQDGEKENPKPSGMETGFSLSRFHQNPVPYLHLVHGALCSFCPNLPLFRLQDYKLEEQLQNFYSFDRFCAQHTLQIRSRGLKAALIEQCHHRATPKCCYFMQSRYPHSRCCHSCFIRKIYQTQANEPFPVFIGLEDVENVVLSYLEPMTYQALILGL